MFSPILSLAQMREWENRTWKAGVRSEVVIATVGRLIAKRLLQLTQSEGRIIILAGKGHNGDDARATIKVLEKEREVTLLNVNSPSQALVDFQQLQSLHGIQLVVDGLFGIGLNRPLDQHWINLIEAITESGIRIISIDVPSGLNLETGPGSGAVLKADRTLTVGAVKQELLLPGVADYVGILELIQDIGLIEMDFPENPRWVTGVPSFPPKRAASSHKGSHGTCGIIAGSPGYHGAAVLSSRGAMRARPGLIHLLTESDSYLPIASQLEMAMVHIWPGPSNLLEKCTSMVMGPGLANPSHVAQYQAFISEKWKIAPIPVVVDASALEWVPQGTFAPQVIRVLTPHPGEAARLLSISAHEVQQDRVKAATEISRRYGECWVVLKGMHTVITRLGGPVFINGSGNPGLAQGGSGDLLAGFLGGLLAQPQLQKRAQETILYGVWQHGAAADFLDARRRNWTMNDLEQVIGDI